MPKVKGPHFGRQAPVERNQERWLTDMDFVVFLTGDLSSASDGLRLVNHIEAESRVRDHPLDGLPDKPSQLQAVSEELLLCERLHLPKRAGNPYPQSEPEQTVSAAPVCYAGFGRIHLAPTLSQL